MKKFSNWSILAGMLLLTAFTGTEERRVVLDCSHIVAQDNIQLQCKCDSLKRINHY